MYDFAGIAESAVYDEAEEPLALPACPDIWEQEPVGGEFTGSIPILAGVPVCAG